VSPDSYVSSPYADTPISISSLPRESSLPRGSNRLDFQTPPLRPRTVSYGSSRRRGQVKTTDEHVTSQLFAVHQSARVIFTCGHWDQSFKATSIDNGRLIQSVSSHKDMVTCLALATHFGRTWLVTGSRDCTLMVWDVQVTKDRPFGNEVALHTLYGHDDAVTSVSLNVDIDVVVSGSDDGTIIIHSLREGTYTRTILVGLYSSSTLRPNHPLNTNAAPTGPTAIASRRGIHWLCITKESYIVAYILDDHMLCTYTVNGRLIATKDVRERLYAILPSEDGQVIVTGGENCLVVFRWVSFYICLHQHVFLVAFFLYIIS
jgi:WD40 repeat protein